MNASQQDRQSLADFIREHRRLVVVTGAGISRDSGIPTYRDDSGRWLPAEPIKHQDFLAQQHTRQRYWARSWYGWPTIRDARPNDAHDALARLEQLGVIEQLITQNVDGLHQRAGNQRVIDLHGRVDSVRCLQCDYRYDRESVQSMLAADNHWPSLTDEIQRPDGDMDIPAAICQSVTPPRCDQCAGNLMPDVVFFGGNVPKARVQQCRQAVEDCDALLVVGSSLMVYSGFRFARQAHRLGKPLAVINPGITRADDIASQRYFSPAAPLLQDALALL